MTEKLLIVTWAIIAGFIILFSPTLFAAETSIKIDGDVVTMSLADYNKAADMMLYQQQVLTSLSNKLNRLEQHYAYVEQCVREEALAGHATTPCLNIGIPTGTMDDYKTMKKNAMEF